jgi:hypothetical protein
MDEPLNGQVLAEGAATNNAPPSDITKVVSEILAAKFNAGALFTTIDEQARAAATKCGEVEQSRLLAEKSRGELDDRLASATATLATLQQQLDSAKSLLAEVTSLHANARAAATEAMGEVESRRGAIATSQGEVDSLVAAVRAQADAAAAKNAEIEQGRLFAEKSRAEIDGKLSAATAALAAAQQQLDSAKQLFVETGSLHASAQTTASHTVELNAKATAALESINGLVNTASENANRVAAIRTDTDQAQAAIATKSQYIEDGRAHAEKARGDIDRLLAEAQRSAANAETQHQASRGTADNMSALLVSAQAARGTVESNASAVEKSRQQCEEHAATAKRLADIADTTHERVSEYEAHLAELQGSAEERLKAIEGLLPGATSAGLASAFKQRRANLTLPQCFWQAVFMVSLFGLVVVAWLEFGWHSVPDAALTWGGLGLSLLHRLPFALPLIWLAFHSSHKAALAQRVQEDYAFKEAVSRSFEGYRREMAELEGKAAPESALSQLCVRVLSIITDPPGRIYEKHQLTKTPLNALAESAGPLADAASRLTPGPIKVGGIEARIG